MADGRQEACCDDENAIAEYKPVWLAPIELMNQYKLEYANPSKNMMGGVLVLKGDIHAFEKSKGTIRIPKFERLADGRLSYFSEEVDLQKELAACFTIQKDRSMFMIRQGDEYNQDEQQRKNITGVHRAWDKFAIDMGWKNRRTGRARSSRMRSRARAAAHLASGPMLSSVSAADHITLLPLIWPGSPFQRLICLRSRATSRKRRWKSSSGAKRSRQRSVRRLNQRSRRTSSTTHSSP